MSLNKDLLHLLVCPLCKGEVVACPQEDGLLCESCQVVYIVEDGIPVMLAESAIPVAEWRGSSE